MKMYVKTKELGPVGGACAGTPLDPPMWSIFYSGLLQNSQITNGEVQLNLKITNSLRDQKSLVRTVQ